MSTARARSLKQWGFAWLGLVAALALHVTDEALNDFLPLYNTTVETLRAAYRWVPLPTFTFRVWLSGLIGLVVLLLALSPFVFRGRRSMLVIAYPLGVIMLANAVGHTVASFYWGIWAPGVYSSPVLFVAALALLVTTRSAQIQARGASGA